MDDWSAFASPLAAELHRAVTQSFLPFWERAIDREHGGVFTCWNNLGNTLISRNKYTWSQGRFAWLCSRLAEARQRGLLPGDPTAALAEAERTLTFLERHVFLDEGDCAFLLSATGEKLEPQPGRGYATSLYADCFVVMGLAEFARVSHRPDKLARAWRLFDRLEQRIAAGGFPTDPEPIPTGYRAHAIAMITLNVAWVIREASDALDDPRAGEARRRCHAGVEEILGEFVGPGGHLREMLPRDNLLTRHINPGHALEGLWIIMTIARREGRRDWWERAHQAVLFAVRTGWDEPYGGLLHYADQVGGPPVGDSGETVYERSVKRTWDNKLWWVHSEAIYATLLAYRLTEDPEARFHCQRLFDYSFATFPQPDPRIGEWIQIRDRQGAPIDKVVALPVKDPYHLLRNWILALDLCAETP